MLIDSSQSFFFVQSPQKSSVDGLMGPVAMIFDDIIIGGELEWGKHL